MGSYWAPVCATAFLLIVMSSASRDEHVVEQREVTFDLDKNMQDMQQPDSFMLQEEVDLSDLFNSEDFQVEQVVVSPKFDSLNERGESRPSFWTPRGRRPFFGPRSFPPIKDYPVQFPLGRPTSDNLQAICVHADHRPRYPASYFPRSGFGQQVRRAGAVNNAESWFSMCCKGNQTWEKEVTLCCATQAWELSVKTFCEEDSSVKDRLYHCCRQSGSERLNCFHNDAPNPNYEPTEELPVPPLPSTGNFNFDPNTCGRTVMTPYGVRDIRGKKGKKPLRNSPKKVDIKFPPGRPTATVIESLCRNQNLRPLYNVRCLPNRGYEWAVRQAKTINRMEKGFKQCCKKKQDVLFCAEQKWREELKKFCLLKAGDQAASSCCLGNRANDQYDCFQNMSPDPYYNMTSATEELSLNKVCDKHKIIKKKFPVGFSLFVRECCPLSAQDQTGCFMQRLEEMSQTACSSVDATPAVRHCCGLPSEEFPQCTAKILMDAVTKATSLSRTKKRCPIS